MSPEKIIDGSPILIGVSLRPENGEKILLLHFNDHTFESIAFKKGNTKVRISLDVRLLADNIYNPYSR